METNKLQWDDYIWWCQIGLVAGAVSMLCFACNPVGEGNGRDDSAVCDEVFSPEPELETLVEIAAERWQEKMGNIICVRPGGIPVVRVTECFDDTGGTACGVTLVAHDDRAEFLRTDQVDISDAAYAYDQCKSLLHVVMHEMGHALSRHDLYDSIHTQKGLMSKYSNDLEEIDMESLLLVCKRGDCY